MGFVDVRRIAMNSGLCLVVVAMTVDPPGRPALERVGAGTAASQSGAMGPGGQWGLALLLG
jgi:hypothetical protein